MIMMLIDQGISDRRLREPFKPFYRIASVTAVIHDYICYGLYGLYHDHFVCYIIVRQQDWRRLVSLVVYRVVTFVQDSWVNRLVYILRENSGRTEELIGYWVRVRVRVTQDCPNW